MTMRNSTILRKALTLLKGGKAWCKDELYEEGAYCALGAICKAESGMVDLEIQFDIDESTIARTPAAQILRRFTVGPIHSWNDQPKRTFTDVKIAFTKAINYAKKQEAR